MFAKILNPSGNEGDQALLVLESNPETHGPSVNLQFEIDHTEAGGPVMGVRFSFDNWDEAHKFFDSCPEETHASSVLAIRAKLKS